MPKFPSIPRLSIVVPVGADLVAFENTLISVLENRPVGCEVLVASDGSYDDPFDLCDEVRFVEADSRSLTDLVAAGAQEARGRFVHVISQGLQATCGWIDAAVENFESHDAGVVVPVIRHRQSHRVIAAGWQDQTGRLCENALQGLERLDRRTVRGEFAPFIQASFWRRELLRSMSEACTLTDTVEASYAYRHLTRSAGWRSVLAPESELVLESATLPWDRSTANRGARLAAIESYFGDSSSWSSAALKATRALAANAIAPTRWLESFGRLWEPSHVADIDGQLHPERVRQCNEESMILSIPRTTSFRSRRRRRAA